MSVEELESIRLSDFEHLDQETAANLVTLQKNKILWFHSISKPSDRQRRPRWMFQAPRY